MYKQKQTRTLQAIKGKQDKKKFTRKGWASISKRNKR